MTQYLLTKESEELHGFPHIVEFAFRKNNTIHFGSFEKTISTFLRFYYIVDGRFEWYIKDQCHILYPGDLAIVFPGQYFGGEKDLLDIGALFWLQLTLPYSGKKRRLAAGKWCSLSNSEYRTINNIFSLNNTPVLSRFKEASIIFQHIQSEFQNQEIGYATRINHLIEELLILTTRQLTKQQYSQRDFPQTFTRLDQALRENLSHQWTVDEMAALMGLGATAFSEKVKSFTGFSPLNYLINIRISAAIKMLKQSGSNITDIALDVGFYSSQHFATTFKKLTGYTPSEFRKNNIIPH